MVLIFPDDWDDVLRILKPSMDSGVCIVVLGNKAVGKSTFIRFLVTKLGARICRMETDCGQPDYSPPGVLNLSVLSDPNRVQVVSQRYLGFVTPSADPIAYVECVEKLCIDYERTLAGTPLVVNLHGWNIGIGAKTYEAVLQVVKPDFVIHIGGNKDDASFAIEAHNPFTSVPLAVPTPVWYGLSPVICLTDDEEGRNLSSMKARDKRWVKFASHFRPDLVTRKEYKSSHPCDFFVPPFSRLLTIPKSKVAVKFLHAQIFPRDPFGNIENLIVGLCNSGSGQCVCLGFVSAADGENVYVLIPPNVLKTFTDSVDQIWRGEMNWSPREQICFNGKTTSTDFTSNPDGEPFFLTNVLVDSDLAKTASTRTNLARKRLS